MLFKNIKIRYNRIINALAATCFGVLQIHSNSDAMRKWLWQDVLKTVEIYNKVWMPLHAIGSVLAIFFICAIIDSLRIHFIEKPFFRIWDNHWENFLEKYKKIENTFCNKLNIQSNN